MNLIANNSFYNKIFTKDILLAYLVFISSIITRYLFPLALGNIFFIAILLVFLISKKNYFWLAVIFILIDPPGFLFFNQGIYHLPQLNINIFGRSIFYAELFMFMIFLKVILHRNKNNFFYKKELYLIFIYIVFLLLLTIFLGTSTLKTLRTIRFILPFFLYIAVPSLFFNESDLERFANILFSFLFLLFAAQLFDIITGKPIAVFLGETSIIFAGSEIDTTNSTVFDISQSAIRTIYGVHILLFSFILSLFYLEKKSNFKKQYLYSVIIISYLAVLLSATRTWFIAFSFVLLLYFFFFPKNLKMTIAGIIITIIILITLPKINLQFNESISRLQTIDLLLKGDISAGGTVNRFTERGPRVMQKFSERPLTGFGYSSEYFAYSDGHVGYQTLLLNGGIVGLIIYFIFWSMFIIKLFKNRHINKALLVFIFGLFGLLIISSSAMIFSYILQVQMGMCLALIFGYANFYSKKSIMYR